MSSKRHATSAFNNYIDDQSGSGSENSIHKDEAPKKRSRSNRRKVTSEDNLNMDEDIDDMEKLSGRRISYEAGQIISIHVENFMCHRKFSIKLGRHLNFITGRNGSGKSAIVAAIQLCLGSSARQTGRGSSVSKYIREGSEDPAVLKVTLLNEGPDAFKPEEYGKRITVKRIIGKTSSSYHLLDVDGKVSFFNY